MVAMVSCVPSLVHDVDQAQVEEGLPLAEEQPYASNDNDHGDAVGPLQVSSDGLKPDDEENLKSSDNTQQAEVEAPAKKCDSEDTTSLGDGELCVAAPLEPAPALRDWRDGLVERGELAREYQVHFCNHFVQMGWCPAQKQCFHAHSVQERRTEAAVKLGVVGLSFKTRLCRSFMTYGVCPRGEFDCKYAHSPAELRQEAAVSSGHLPLHYCTTLCADVVPQRGACLAPGCMKAHFPGEVRAFRKYAIPGVTYCTSLPAASAPPQNLLAAPVKAAPASSSSPPSRSRSPSPPRTPPPPEQELRGHVAPVTQKEAIAGGSPACLLPDHLYDDDVTSLQSNDTPLLLGIDREEAEQAYRGFQASYVGRAQSGVVRANTINPAMPPLGLGAGYAATATPRAMRQPVMLSPHLLALGHVYPHPHGIPSAARFFPPQMPNMLFHQPMSISYAHSPLHGTPVPYFSQPPMMQAMPSMSSSAYIHSTTPK